MKQILLALCLWAATAHAQNVLPSDLANPVKANYPVRFKHLYNFAQSSNQVDSLLKVKTDSLANVVNALITYNMQLSQAGLLNRYTRQWSDSNNTARSAYNTSTYQPKSEMVKYATLASVAFSQATMQANMQAAMDNEVTTVNGKLDTARFQADSINRDTALAARPTFAQANSAYQGKGDYATTASLNNLQMAINGKLDASVAASTYATKNNTITPADTIWLHNAVAANAGAITTNGAAIAGKFPQPTGTINQYLRGDGTAATFPALFDGSYSSLTGKPYTFTPSAHTHVIADVTGLQTVLDGKQATIGYTPYNATNPAGYISAVPGTYATTATNDSRYYPLSTNPASYLTSVSSSQITTALGYTPLAAVPATYGTVVYNDGRYYPLTGNPSVFLTAENDPTVPSYSKTLTAFSTIKSSTDPLYRPITYTPSSSDISTGLGYTPVNSTALASYATTSALSSGLSVKMNYTDTAAMLAPYLRSATVSALYATVSAVNGKVNISDTSSMLAPYLRKVDTTGKWLWFPTTNNAPSRALVNATNAAGYRISTTRPTSVSYSVQFAYTVNALSTLTGTAYCYLEISPDNSAWTTVAQIGETPVLTALTTRIFNLNCVVPSGWYVRQRTATTSVLGGTITLTPSFQQEATN